jgi:transcription elongation factor Elf1
MKIYACPKCGSKNIHIGTLDSGVTYGITSWDYTCKDCDYKGMPLIFYSENEYKQFLKGLLKDLESRTKSESDENKKIDNKTLRDDKELLIFIKKLIDKESKEKEDIRTFEKTGWHKNRSWWIEISLAFIISGLLFLFGSSTIIIFDFGAYTLFYIIYMIILFFIQAIIILAIIVVIEYFILFKFLK